MATPSPLDDLVAQLRRGGTSNPFYLLSNQFLPRNFNDVIRWSRFVLVNSPTLAEVIRKYSTYPITSFIIDSKIEAHEASWKKIIKKVKLKSFLEEAGFSYYSMGNFYFSIYYPLQRMLVCPSCKAEYTYAESLEFVKFKNYTFEGNCPSCQKAVKFVRNDRKSKSIESLRLVSWTVENVSVHKNPITGDVNYYYTIPAYVKKGISSGDPMFISTTPWSIIQAVKEGKDYLFDKNNFFHLKNMSFGDLLNGYGLPPLISSYSFIFYQVLLRKANEAIAMERLTSMRIISPRPASGNSDPSMGLNLRSFAANMTENLRRFKRDPNHVMISPVPTEVNNVGGDGRALLVTQELQAAEDTVLLGMGIPRELMAGTLNWTSSTVGLRLLENTITNYVEQVIDMLDFIVEKINNYFDYNDVHVSLVPFKLVDDDAARQQIGAMFEKGFVSPSTWLEAFGFDLKEEQDKVRKDTITMETSKIETEHEVRLAKFAKARDLTSRGGGETEVSRAELEAHQMAMQIMSLATPDAQKQALFQIKASNPGMYQLVASFIESLQNMPTSAQDQQDPNAPQGQTAEGSDQQTTSQQPEQGQQP